MKTARPWRKFRSVNSNTTGFPAWVGTEFNPPVGDAGTAAGRVLMRLAEPGGVVPCAMRILPFGTTGGTDEAFSIRVVALHRIEPPIADGRVQYIREVLAVLSATLGDAGGRTDGILSNIEPVADAIAVTFEGTVTSDTTRDGTVILYSPANNTAAFAVVPLLGAEIIELEFDQTTGTPTMNALVSFLDGD